MASAYNSLIMHYLASKPHEVSKISPRWEWHPLPLDLSQDSASCIGFPPQIGYSS